MGGDDGVGDFDGFGEAVECLGGGVVGRVPTLLLTRKITGELF